MAAPDPKNGNAGERWRANLLGLIVVVLLVAGGIWLIDALIDAAEYEKCVASRRRNCDRINLNAPAP